MKKNFNKRSVISLTLLVMSIMMPVSALVTHANHGSEMSHVWLHIHVLFGLIFVITCIFHVVINWKTLKYYLFGKNKN